MYNSIPMFTPTSDRVLVRKFTDEKSAGGVLLPPSTKMQFEKGVILAVGPGARSATGELIPSPFKIGQTVLFSGTSAADVRVDGETLWLMTESAILGIADPVPLPGPLSMDPEKVFNSLPE